MKFVFSIPMEVRVEEGTHQDKEHHSGLTLIEIPVEAPTLEEAQKKLTTSFHRMMMVGQRW